MQSALLLVAHGSRRAQSNDEIHELTARLRSMATEQFNSVACAFLELASPTIPDGIEALIHDGAEKVVVLPYFLAAGNHIVEDIPEQVAIKQAEYPKITIEIAPYLGSADAIPKILLSLVDR